MLATKEENQVMKTKNGNLRFGKIQWKVRFYLTIQLYYFFFANVVLFVVRNNLLFLQDLVFLFYLISFPVAAEIWSCIIAAKWKGGA